MSHLSNRSILEKADLALADLTAGGGLLQPAQAQKFMRLLIKQSVLLQLATVVPMASPKQQISKIKFGSRILRPGQEATALPPAQRAAPYLSPLELDAKMFKRRRPEPLHLPRGPFDEFAPVADSMPAHKIADAGPFQILAMRFPGIIFSWHWGVCLSAFFWRERESPGRCPLASALVAECRRHGNKMANLLAKQLERVPRARRRGSIRVGQRGHRQGVMSR